MITEVIDALDRHESISWLFELSPRNYFEFVESLPEKYKNMVYERDASTQELIKCIENDEDLSWLYHLSHNDYFMLIDGLPEYYMNKLEKKQNKCLSVAEYQYITYEWKHDDLQDLYDHELDFLNDCECFENDDEDNMLINDDIYVDKLARKEV
jgi:hypothetical protein